jgi:hypothetical protein
MSIFSEQRLACPACDTPVRCEVVHSVNIDRKPELRDAILDGSFQRVECPSCGSSFRPEPELIYIDRGRGQYIGVWPASRRGEWAACAAKTRETFDGSFGAQAPASARQLGAAFNVRAVFGWPAFIEKLLAREAGIDDRTLEAAKLVVMRSGETTPLPGTWELRLMGVQEGDPVLAWLGPAADDDESPRSIRVPRALIEQIDSEPEAWQALRESVAEGDVVDFQRDMLVA